MKAIVKTEEGNGHVALMEWAEPVPRPGEVKIRVEAAGICGTDLKIWSGEAWSNPPVVLCHEFSGVVTEVGEGVTLVSPGDRVIAETPQVVCGACYYCRTDHLMMCPERLSIGYGVDGAFADYIVVRDGIVHRIPDTLSYDEAAVCEPLAVAVHAVYDAVALKPTDAVLVSGPGTIGLLVAQVAASFGCRVICCGVSTDADRLQIARRLGAGVTVNLDKENLQSLVMEQTGGLGVDYVFECSGNGASVESAIRLVRRLGTVVQVGLTEPTLNIPYALLSQREISIRGTFGHNWLSWDTALRLMQSGKVDVKPLISHVYAMDQWEAAFRAAQERQGVKVIIHPNA